VGVPLGLTGPASGVALGSTGFDGGGADGNPDAEGGTALGVVAGSGAQAASASTTVATTKPRHLLCITSIIQEFLGRV
jgi:hypothetical protein